LPGDSQHDHCRLQQVQFADGRRGWIRTADGLWRTSDGGSSWKHVFIAAEQSYVGDSEFGFFQFLDRKRGWALIDEKLFQTGDAGSTWSRSMQPSGCLGLYGFAFSQDGTRGWAAGAVERRLRKHEELPNRFSRKVTEDGGGTGVFPAAFVTRDSGASWHRQPMPRVPGDLYYVSAAGDTHAWAIGQSGYFYLDRGRWRVSESDTYGSDGTPRVAGLEVAIGLPTFAPINLFFLTERHGWLVNSNGALSVTHDGGCHWTDLVTHDAIWGPAYSEQCFVEVYFADLQRGLAIDDSGDLFASADGGKSWNRVASNLRLRDLFFLASGQGWAVSETDLYRIDLHALERRKPNS
jgi:photosystem II stability/assembly factor-like uncharacterized protein